MTTKLIGDRLVAARYGVLAGGSWTNHGDVVGVHEVDMDVELATESGLILGISWSIPGSAEGLALELRRNDEPRPNERIDLVDVSDQSEWSPVLGRSVGAVAISFHAHDDGSIRPWAVRIGISSDVSVTVALGEVDDGQLYYRPNNLLVIFDEPIARDYHIPSSTQSAWGELVATSDS